MAEFFFGVHRGHLTAKADRIARRHGASYTDATGERRGWFVADNRGSPFDQRVADAVLADIEKAGGIDALRYARDR